MLAGGTVASLIHTLLRGVQQAVYGRRIACTKLRDDPLFIIGHWRTGTTLLHELLTLDEQHIFPTTYSCMDPNHFLLTETFFTKCFPFFAPKQRPMDGMTAGFDRPQEDEFALCMLGQPSPYLTIAFPNSPPQCQEYLDLKALSPRQLASWKRTYLQFLKELTLKDSRRLVLKSPTHSCRIKVLQEMFPRAQFVHIVRDPYVVFPSTVHLWKSLYTNYALQQPNFRGLEEYVLENFVRIAEGIEQAKKLVDARRFYELRYEDLTTDPIGQLRALYDHLGLSGFDRMMPRLQGYLARTAEYRTNGYHLTDDQRAKINNRWGHIIRRQGYSMLLRPKLATANPSSKPPANAAKHTIGLHRV